MDEMKISDDENCVSDLEYICNNVIEDGYHSYSVNDNACTNKNNLKSNFFYSNADTNSSSSSSPYSSASYDDEIHSKHSQTNVSCVGYLKHANKEDGELSSDKELDDKLSILNNIMDDSKINNISLNDNTHLVSFGAIKSIVGNTVVATALPNCSIVDLKTSVFLNDKTHIGQIYDLFGRIESPFYSVIVKKSVLERISPNMEIFYANLSDLVNFVDVEEIKNDYDKDTNSFEDELLLEEKSLKNNQNKRKNNNKKRNNLNKYNNITSNLNAWPPSLEMLNNSYEMRTFYKYGQWPSSNLKTNTNSNHLYQHQKKN